MGIFLYLPILTFSQASLDTLGVSDFNSNITGAEKYLPLLTEKTADVISRTGRLYLVDLTSNQSVNKVIERAQENYKGNYAKLLAELAYKKGSLDNITVITYLF